MKQNRRVFLKKIGITSAGIGTFSILPFNGKSQQTASAQSNCNPCTLDFYGQGPFYTPNSPTIINGQLATSNEPGERLIIRGRVTNLDCTEFIADAIIDVWHADDAGAYDNVGFKFRGVTKTDAQGYYEFETIKPGKYLNGNQYRPSHIHFKITAPGKPELTTQLYFEGDTDIPADAAASINSGTYDATHRIIPLTMVNGKWEGTWDIALAGDGIPINTGATLHLDKGMIYDVFPNPFTESFNLKVGVFKDANVTLKLYDLSGKLLDMKALGNLTTSKYNLQWKPQVHLPKGLYVLALSIHDLQVQTLQLIKE